MPARRSKTHTDRAVTLDFRAAAQPVMRRLARALRSGGLRRHPQKKKNARVQ